MRNLATEKKFIIYYHNLRGRMTNWETLGPILEVLSEFDGNQILLSTDNPTLDLQDTYGDPVSLVLRAFGITAGEDIGLLSTQFFGLYVPDLNDATLWNGHPKPGYSEQMAMAIEWAKWKIRGLRPDRSTYTFSIIQNPEYGTLTIDPATGQITYTPNQDWSGTDSFLYQTIAANGVKSPVAQMNIIINPVNDTPQAQDQNVTFTVPEGEDNPSFSGNLPVSDADNSPDQLTYEIVSGPDHGGNVTIHADGTYTYVPAHDFYDTETFTYRVFDGTDYSNVATITITTVLEMPEGGSVSLDLGPAPESQDPNATYTVYEVLPDGTTQPVDWARNYPVGSYAMWPIWQSLLNADGGSKVNPAVFKGVLFQMTWGMLERDPSSCGAPSCFDWSVLDARIAEAQQLGLKVEFSIRASPMTAPDYIQNDPNVQKISFVDMTPEGFHPETRGTLVTVPAFWDPTFLNHKLELIRALGARYSNNPTVVAVMSSFANLDTDDWWIETRPKNFEGPLNTDLNAPPQYLGTYDNLQVWLDAAATLPDSYGTTPADKFVNKMFEIGQEVIRTTAESFSHQELKLPLDAPNTRALKDATLSANILQWAYQTYPERFYIQMNRLKSTGNYPSPYANILNDDLDFGNPEGPNSNWYSNNGQPSYAIYKELIHFGNLCDHHIGIQMFTHHPGNHDELETDANIGLSYQPSFMEYWSDDSSDPNFSDIFGDVTNTIRDNLGNELLITPSFGNGGDHKLVVEIRNPDGTLVVTKNFHLHILETLPAASDRDVWLSENQSWQGMLPYGGQLQFIQDSGPAHGQFTLNGDGTYVYTPATDFAGTDSMTYRLFDGENYSNVAEIRFHVAPVIYASVNEDEPITMPLPGGDPLTFSWVQGPSNGTLTVNQDGTLTYTPNANFNGRDSITYKLFDGTQYSEDRYIQFQVNPVNDPPQAQDLSTTVDQGGSVTFTLVGSDIDGDKLTYILSYGPGHGKIVINKKTGIATYTPWPNFHGNDSFSYRVFDGESYSDFATVSITVVPLNGAALAAPSGNNPGRQYLPGALGQNSQAPPKKKKRSGRNRPTH